MTPNWVRVQHLAGIGTLIVLSVFTYIFMESLDVRGSYTVPLVGFVASMAFYISSTYAIELENIADGVDSNFSFIDYAVSAGPGFIYFCLVVLISYLANFFGG